LHRVSGGDELKTIILSGGLGTRLAEQTDVRPKPMVEIGGRPILWHIMNLYAYYDFSEFLIALGYKGEIIKDYFLNYYYMRNDISVHLASGQTDVHDGAREDWTVHLIDTGLHSHTGGRVRRLRPWIGDKTFMMTYGDGVADVDIRRLVQFHRSHGKLATITAVRPAARFGGLTFESDQVTRFVEKPRIGEGWVNGGFFVLEPEVLEYLRDDETAFEGEPLEELARDGQLMAYRHEGFWQCMDTLRDVRMLEQIWQSGEVPWKVWQ
jgi:glucose-1-phosphate cytidylyltransferase